MKNIQRLQRFFEPLQLLGLGTLGAGMVILIWRLYDIAITLVMKGITNAFQHHDIISVNRRIMIAAIGFVCYELLAYYIQQKNLFITTKLQQHIIKKYLPTLLEKEHLYRENQGTGKMLTHIKEGIMRRSEFNFIFLHRTISITMSILGSLYIMQSGGIRYFFCLLVVLVISTQIAYYFRKKANIYRKRKYESKTATYRQLIKMIMSRNDIIYNNQTIPETETMYDNIEKEYQRGLKQRPYEHIGSNITMGTIDVAKIVILVILGYQVLGGTIGFGDLLASTTIIGLLSKAINDYIESLREYMKNGFNIENLRKILDDTPSILGYNTGKNFHYQSGTIVFDKVSFAYGDKEVITNCSLTIPGGKKIALVGHSGGGKTTIAKLIAGYLHPSSGSLLVDGQQLPTPHSLHDTINLKSYYRHIAYLTQEPSVFDGTILENLTFGLNISDPARLSESEFPPVKGVRGLENAIIQAQCQFIYDFPQGLHTEIGEKGIKLSGGQRQRLAIARVFLKNPEIIILDEPTSALDSVSEHAITQAMHNLFIGRTVIIIAHRLQTVKDADIIVMIEQGHITAQGTHSELLETNTHYQELVNLQSGW